MTTVVEYNRLALFRGGGGELVRERDSPEMGSPKRPRTPRVLATFWASYGPTPPTPIRPKNAQNRALRASSVPRKFRRQNARQLFFLGANIFHKNLPRQLFFLKFFFRVDTDSDSKSKKFSRRLRRRESYVNSQKIFWCFRSRCALARPGSRFCTPTARLTLLPEVDAGGAGRAAAPLRARRGLAAADSARHAAHGHGQARRARPAAAERAAAHARVRGSGGAGDRVGSISEGPCDFTAYRV